MRAKAHKDDSFFSFYMELWFSPRSKLKADG
jgi:hypothetical protein